LSFYFLLEFYMNQIKRNLQKGFTLIELMIVVAIIGILAAIAIPQYSDYTSRARASGAVAELASLKTAISVCIADQGGVVGNCDTMAKLGIGAWQTTSNITAAPTLTATTAVINATTGATTTAGAALLYTLTPAVGTGGNMLWTGGGTICGNPTRGLKAGQGDC
jgi:prepilin-type N-terminal cleavage/methylation domain-containing protein